MVKCLILLPKRVSTSFMIPEPLSSCTKFFFWFVFDYMISPGIIMKEYPSRSKWVEWWMYIAIVKVKIPVITLFY